MNVRILAILLATFVAYQSVSDSELEFSASAQAPEPAPEFSDEPWLLQRWCGPNNDCSVQEWFRCKLVLVGIVEGIQLTMCIDEPLLNVE